MEDADRIKLEQHIRRRIEELKANIVAYEELVRPIAPDNAIGRITRMEAINQKSVNEAALRTARMTLSRLERALARIDHEDFGLCRECEEPIPMGRLMVMPETDLCVACAQRLHG